MSELEDALAFQVRAHGLDKPEREYAFLLTRRFRFDFAWPQHKVAVEVQGGTWSQGRHARGAGIESDCEKMCKAALGGWTVLPVTSKQIDDGRAVLWIKELLERRAQHARGLEQVREEA